MTTAFIEALVRDIAVSYGSRGIRAVAVAPGANVALPLRASFETGSNPLAERSRLERRDQ